MNLIQIISLISCFVLPVVFFTINKANPELNPKRIILYTLLFAILIGVGGGVGYFTAVTESVWLFVLLQILYTLMGVFYYRLLKLNFFGYFTYPNFSGGLLTFITAALGLIVFVFCFDYLCFDDLATHYGMSILMFLIPFLFLKTFEMLLRIPPEIHKVWFYPLGEEEPDFDEIDLNKIYLVELEFTKSINDTEIKNYKVKAPLDLKFGDWYRSFLDNYNYKFDQDPIQFMDDQQNPFGWSFTNKPKNWWQSPNFIDPDLTIKQNKITENTVIVAKRVEAE